MFGERGRDGGDGMVEFDGGVDVGNSEDVGSSSVRVGEKRDSKGKRVVVKQMGQDSVTVTVTMT